MTMPAAVAGGHGHRQHLALDGLALHRQVAILVGGRPADDGDVDREGVVEQPLAAAQGDHLDEVLGRARVLLAAGLTWVHVRAEARPAVTRPGRPAAISRISCESTPCGNEYDSIWSASTSAPEARLVADVAADGPAHEAGQPELREAPVGEVADARRRGPWSGRAAGPRP